MSLGNNIKKYRHDLGMTQEELAERNALHNQSGGKQMGERSRPSGHHSGDSFGAGAQRVDRCIIRLQY